MLTHNIVPDNMLCTLVPIPKNRKKYMSESNNCRSMARSIIIGKVLDTIIYMDKNMHGNDISIYIIICKLD